MTETAQNEPMEPSAKPRGGAPKGNKNAETHDLHTAKATLAKWGARAIHKGAGAGFQWNQNYLAFCAEFGVVPNRKRGEDRTLHLKREELRGLATGLWLVQRIQARIVGGKGNIRQLTAERNELIATYHRHRREVYRLFGMQRANPADEPRLEDVFEEALQ